MGKNWKKCGFLKRYILGTTSARTFVSVFIFHNFVYFNLSLHLFPLKGIGEQKSTHNTSLNKFLVWHIDGTTVVKSIWFLDSTNFQTLSVKISWQSDVLFRSYRGFGDATFVIFKTMDKKEFRVLIEHCFLMEKNTVEAKQWLDKRYGDSTPGKSTIIDWYAEFRRSRTNTDDAERSGRPESAVVPENITKVHIIVLDDRKFEMREIADTLKISEDSVFTISHKSLEMRKLFSKWVPVIPERWSWRPPP